MKPTRADLASSIANNVANLAPAAWLLTGQVMHERLRPKHHRFTYPVFYVRCDLDRLASLDSGWFGIDRWRPLSLDRRDHGPRDGSDLAAWYDGIVSIEMFEAVGEQFWPTYFGILRERLRPGARALVQTITIDDSHFAAYRATSDFIREFIFPGGMLPSPRRFIAIRRRARRPCASNCSARRSRVARHAHEQRDGHCRCRSLTAQTRGQLLFTCCPTQIVDAKNPHPAEKNQTMREEKASPQAPSRSESANKLKLLKRLPCAPAT
jgi:hypothetical protein